MARILTVDPEQARGIRKLIGRMIRRQFGVELPGVFKILLADFHTTTVVGWKQHRGCRWIRCQEKRLLPKQLLVWKLCLARVKSWS